MVFNDVEVNPNVVTKFRKEAVIPYDLRGIALTDK